MKSHFGELRSLLAQDLHDFAVREALIALLRQRHAEDPQAYVEILLPYLAAQRVDWPNPFARLHANHPMMEWLELVPFLRFSIVLNLRDMVQRATATRQPIRPLSLPIGLASELCFQGPLLDARTWRELLHSPAVAGVQKIEVSFTPSRDPLMSTEHVRALASSPHLERLGHLNLRRAGLDATALSPLLEGELMGRLEILELPYNALGERFLRMLAACQECGALEQLHLRGNERVSPRALRALASAPWCGGLRALGLSSIPQLGAAGARILAQAEGFLGLESLDLSGCDIMDEGAQALASSRTLGSLRALDLSHNQLSDKGGLALVSGAHFAQLERLDLRHNLITTPALKGATSLRQLKSFAFTQPPGSASKAQETTQLLSALDPQRLEHLELGHLPLNEDGAALIAAMRGLRTLTLEACELRDPAMQLLMQQWSSPQLEVLALGHNRLGDASAQAVACAPGLEHVRRLELSHNRIGDAGVTALAMTSTLPGLRELDLRHNRLRDGAVEALLAARSSMQRLDRLLLQGHIITHALASQLEREYAPHTLVQVHDVA